MTRLLEEIDELNELINDEEMKALAEEELSQKQEQLIVLQEDAIEDMIPEDEYDESDAILETKAGVGGSEGALFALDLLEMYKAYSFR